MRAGRVVPITFNFYGGAPVPPVDRVTRETAGVGIRRVHNQSVDFMALLQEAEKENFSVNFSGYKSVFEENT